MSPVFGFRPLLRLRDVPLAGNLAVVAAGTLANETLTLLPVALP